MWATIIAAIIGIAGTAISAGVNSKNQRESKKEAKELAMIARDDQLKQQSREFGIAEKQIGISKETLGLNKVKTNFEMTNTRKSNNATQLSNLSSSLDILSKRDQNMSNFVLSLYGKGAK